MASELVHDSPLWRYAVTLYQRSGVSDWLLGIQDRLAVDVNFVLLACWCGEQGMELEAADWRQLAGATQTLRCAVITPLRRQRRHLDGVAPPVVRSALLQAELTAENALYEELWQWYLQHCRPGETAYRRDTVACSRHNLDSLASYHGIPGFPGVDLLLRNAPVSV